MNKKYDWVMVPRIATTEMVEAGAQFTHIVDLWSAMVEAAPNGPPNHLVHIDDSIAFADQVSEQHRLRANAAEARLRQAADTLIEPGEGWQAYALRLRQQLTDQADRMA